jgi:hypothetical protein
MNKFLDVNDLPKLNQVDVNHLNKLVTNNEFEAIIKNFLTKKIPGLDSLLTSTRPLRKN